MIQTIDNPRTRDDTTAPPASSPPSIGSAITFRTLTKHYGDAVALDRVDLDIPIGQTVALLGANGAGKSTAINIMLGLVTPDAGEVRTLGQEPRVAIESGRVGSMLQTAGLPIGARVAELVEFTGALYPHPLTSAETLERAGLAGLATRRVESLSGGEAQRVRFALAIAGDPDLIFLDEPTMAMDVESRRAFWADMRRFAAQGRTVLFATHYLEEADQVADRIVVLDRGRIIADGTGASIKARVVDRTVQFTLPDADPTMLRTIDAVTSVDIRGAGVTLQTDDADATVRAMAGRHIPFRDLEVVGADLERAFIKLLAANGER